MGDFVYWHQHEVRGTPFKKCLFRGGASTLMSRSMDTYSTIDHRARFYWDTHRDHGLYSMLKQESVSKQTDRQANGQTEEWMLPNVFSPCYAIKKKNQSCIKGFQTLSLPLKLSLCLLYGWPIKMHTCVCFLCASERRVAWLLGTNWSLLHPPCWCTTHSHNEPV